MNSNNYAHWRTYEQWNIQKIRRPWSISRQYSPFVPEVSISSYELFPRHVVVHNIIAIATMIIVLMYTILNNYFQLSFKSIRWNFRISENNKIIHSKYVNNQYMEFSIKIIESTFYVDLWARNMLLFSFSQNTERKKKNFRNHIILENWSLPEIYVSYTRHHVPLFILENEKTCPLSNSFVGIFELLCQRKNAVI